MESNWRYKNTDADYAILQTIVEDAGVGIYETSLDGSYVYVNALLAKQLGYDSAEAFLEDSRHSSEFHADPEAQNNIRGAIDSGEQITTYTHQVIRRDGSTFWVREQSSPVRDQDGNITGYVGTVTDIDELVRTQQSLAEAEESYRRIFERATEGIYRSSLDGRQLRANPALNHLNGYETEEEHLNAVKDIAKEWYVDPERRDEFKRILNEQGRVEAFESEIYCHGSRDRIWISENAYLVRDEAGDPLFYEGTVRDITANKQAENRIRAALEQAEEASRAKTEFLAQMSHELRTPLNAIIGFSEMITTEIFGKLNEPKYLEYATDIKNSSEHLLSIINDILDLSKIEAGKVEVEPTVFSIDQVLGECVKIFNSQHHDTQHKIQVEISPETPTLYADKRIFRQIMINLLSNADKYTTPGGCISVKTSRADDDAIILTVNDNGLGIAADDLKRVLEPFGQSRDHVEIAHDGTGLGLPISKELMELQGGHLDIQSELGKGTTVTLTFPTVKVTNPDGLVPCSAKT